MHDVPLVVDIETGLTVPLPPLESSFQTIMAVLFFVTAVLKSRSRRTYEKSPLEILSYLISTNSTKTRLTSPF